MGFAALLGLIALIGIPIIIIIYILKPRFQERKISSTYVWKLSLKYRKRKIPIQWLKSLLLLVQCIVVAVVSMLIAKPYLANSVRSYAYEKVVIIDASASMMASNGKKTRFERAIEEAGRIAESAEDTKEMTVILANDDPEVVVNFESNPTYIKGELSKLKCSGTTANYEKAIIMAQAILDRNSEAGVTLITDHEFEDSGYIELINVSDGEWNIAIDDAWNDIENDVTHKDYGENILIANIISYNKKSTVIPCAKITYKNSTTSQTNNDSDYSTVIVKADMVELKENTTQQVTFDYTTIRAAMNKRLTSYKVIEFYLEDENGVPISDGFKDDDRFFIYGGENNNYKVLLVSPYNFYTNMVMSAMKNCDIETLNPNTHKSEVDKKVEGYDLYVYEDYIPEKLPVDGAIWVINPPQTTEGFKNLGFSVTSTGTMGNLVGSRINAQMAAHEILKGIQSVDGPMPGTHGIFSYSKYTSINVTDTTILKKLVETESGDPLILAGRTGTRINVVVFAFDFRFTDFPLVFQNFPIMIQNMTKFSVARTLNNFQYEIGQTSQINAKPNATKVEIMVGEGELTDVYTYQDVQLAKPIQHQVSRGGVYTVAQTLFDHAGNTKIITSQFFVRCNSEESNFAIVGPILTSPDYGAYTEGETKQIREYIFKYFAAALLIFLLIEWGLQYREQY